MSWHGIPIPYSDVNEWLTLRHAKIGASDVAGILGMSPWSTPFTVWAEKTGRADRDQDEAMGWGLRLEDVILDAYEEREGLYVGDRQMFVQHPKWEWATATIDGNVYEGPPESLGDYSIGCVEAKNVAKYGRWTEVPDHYQIQAQWQMFVTGHEHAWIVALHGGNRLEVYPLDAEPGTQNMMFDKVSAWRTKYLVGGLDNPEIPAPDGSYETAKVIGDLWEPDDELTVPLDDEIAGDLDTLRGLKEEKKRLEGLITERENRVKVALGEATAGLVDGEVAVTWKFRDGYHRKAVDVAPGRTFSVKARRQ